MLSKKSIVSIGKIMAGVAKDLIGQTFTRLKVMERVDPPEGVTHKNRAYWLCLLCVAMK